MHKTIYKIIIFLICFTTLTITARAAQPISIAPISVIQGDPAQIVVLGITSPSQIASFTVNGKRLVPFIYNGNVQVIYGVDIHHKTGDFPVVVKIKNKKVVRGVLTVHTRAEPTLAFEIPDSLGGTNPTGEKNVITLLTKENEILAHLKTNPKKLWKESFIFPVESPIVTDTYGYIRDTSTQTITHKGTDFHAPTGTPIYAINRGVVRLVQHFDLYGNTVVIDHGQGIMSFYMHLSKINVEQGFIVEEGQSVGESGMTGYAEGEHLHLTIRINNISIDPMRFFALYGKPIDN